MSFVTKNDIIRNVNILDIAAEFGISVESTSSGNFNYRCKCPSSEHKNGNERTGSCYIDSVNNNFYCFGCNYGSNVIDFYMACADLEFGPAMSVLRKRVNSKDIKKKVFVNNSNNFTTMLKISKMIRKAILEHPDDLKWINNLMRKTDQYTANMKNDECKKANALYQKIKATIQKRYE